MMPISTGLDSILQIIRYSLCILLIGLMMHTGKAPASLPNAQHLETFIASLPLEQAKRQTLVELLSSHTDSGILELQTETGQHVFSQNASFSEETTRANLACKISQAVFVGENQYIDPSTDGEYYTERTQIHW